MFELYHLLFYRPLLNILVLLYETIGVRDLGLAIIFCTLIVRSLLFPLFQKTVRYQTVIQRLQPEIKKIKETAKGNKEKEVRDTMALYKTHRVNPISGFFLLIAQLPVLLALFHILQSLDDGVASALYSFVPRPQELNRTLLGLIDLEKPSILIVGVAALAQYVQGKMSMAKSREGEAPSPAERMSRHMGLYLVPLIMLGVLMNVPAAVSLYIVVSTAFSLVQQRVVNKELTYAVGNTREDNT